MPSAPSQRPPYRLRDLKARERWVAGVLVLVMMAPFVLSVGRAIRADWYPLGDDALISLRAGGLPRIFRWWASRPPATCTGRR